jgi:hypothetical protein
MSNISSQATTHAVVQYNVPTECTVSSTIDVENRQLLYISSLLSELTGDFEHSDEINEKLINELLDRLF